MEVKLSSTILNANYTEKQSAPTSPGQNMMILQEDFVRARPNKKHNNRILLKRDEQENKKAEKSKRFQSIGGESSLSEIDMEENGYFESNRFYENKTTSETLQRDDFAQLASINDRILETRYSVMNEDFSNGIKPTDKVDSTSRNLLTAERKGDKQISLETSINNSFTVKSNDMLSLSSSICSDESLEGELPNEHARLTTVLNNIDSKRLHNYLKRKLKQNDLTTILALSSLLPKKKFKAETLHCVRCHQEFDPKHGDKTCRLYHRNSDVIKISEDPAGTDFGCEHCGAVFRVEGRWKYKQSLNKKHNCGSCFSGKHTISSDDVMYEPEGIAKTCEDYGCIVFYV